MRITPNEIEAYDFQNHSSGATGVQKQKSVLCIFTGFVLFSDFSELCLIRQYGWSLISCCYSYAVWCPRVRREVLGAGRMLSRRRAAATEDDDQ